MEDILKKKPALIIMIADSSWTRKFLSFLQHAMIPEKAKLNDRRKLIMSRIFMFINQTKQDNKNKTNVPSGYNHPPKAQRYLFCCNNTFSQASSVKMIKYSYLAVDWL